MPLPSIKTGESKQSFIARCMSDSKTKEEFPDSDQRLAVCMSKSVSCSLLENVDIHYYNESYGYTELLDQSTYVSINDEDYLDFGEQSEEIELSIALQYGKPKKNDPRKTPAPKKDQKKGSKKNKPDSAKDDKGNIKFSEKTIKRLENLVKDHNEKINKKGKGSKATLGMLKAVYRRGAGAFSSSHHPNMSRDGWAIARVNAFLYLLRNNRPSNPNYKQDNDLLPKNHPRSTKAIYSEAEEYRGKKIKLNKPFRTPDGPKKFSVYVKNDKGNVVKVNFGDPNMDIKRDDPKRRKNFRARHQCDTNPGPKWKARYWSCKFWSSPKVSDLL